MIKKIKILVSGSYGSGNCGDEIILEQIVYELKDRATLTVTTHSKEYINKYFKDIDGITEAPPVWGLKRLIGDVVKLRWKNIVARVKFIYEVFKCDTFLLGGGGLLSESVVTVLQGYLQQVKIASFFGKNIVIYCVGIGPLRTESGKRNLYDTLKKVSNHICVRDKISLDHLSSVGIHRGPFVIPDPAFSYPIKMRNREDSNTIIVNIYELFTNSVIWPNGKKRRESFETILIKTILSLITKDGYEVVLLPFGTHEDYLYSQKILKMIDHPSCSVFDSSQGHNLIVNQFYKARFSITMRFHAGLLSMMSLVPSICVDAQFKSERLLKDMQLEELLVDFSGGISKDLAEDLQEDVLINKCEYVQKNYHIIESSITQYKKKIKEDYNNKISVVREWIYPF